MVSPVARASAATRGVRYREYGPLGSRAKLDRGQTEAIRPVGPEAREQALAFQRAEQAQRRALGQVEGPREIGEPHSGV